LIAAEPVEPPAELAAAAAVWAFKLDNEPAAAVDVTNIIFIKPSLKSSCGRI